jgi:G3E family GTPase
MCRGEPFDHILVELSGVAEPAAVRRNLAAATDAEVARPQSPPTPLA